MAIVSRAYRVSGVIVLSRREFRHISLMIHDFHTTTKIVHGRDGTPQHSESEVERSGAKSNELIAFIEDVACF